MEGQSENQEQVIEATGEPVSVQEAQFPNQVASSTGAASSTLGRFKDVSIEVSAHLGNVRMSIGDLLELVEGSVVELNRATSEPVELYAQGVKIADGEVVVIDDCFAIRIKEVENQNQ